MTKTETLTKADLDALMTAFNERLDGFSSLSIDRANGGGYHRVAITPSGSFNRTRLETLLGILTDYEFTMDRGNICIYGRYPALVEA